MHGFSPQKTAPILAPHQRYIKLGLSFVLGWIVLQMVKSNQEELNLPILVMNVSLGYLWQLQVFPNCSNNSRGWFVLSLETLNVCFLLGSVHPALLVACKLQPNIHHFIRQNDGSNTIVLIVALYFLLLHDGCFCWLVNTSTPSFWKVWRISFRATDCEKKMVSSRMMDFGLPVLYWYLHAIGAVYDDWFIQSVSHDWKVSYLGIWNPSLLQKKKLK